MKNFRVTASRVVLENPPRNPFMVAIENFRAGKRITRIWTFEAASEEVVRRHWEEAQLLKLPYVDGFTLDRIEEI